MLEFRPLLAIYFLVIIYKEDPLCDKDRSMVVFQCTLNAHLSEYL